MAEQDAFSFALYNLLHKQRESETIIKTLMTYLENDFQWLDEITEAACSAFTVKSMKLEPMPKTPCVTNKMQKRKRKKEETCKIELGSTPTSSKVRHTSSIEDEVNTDSTTTGRPVRQCRISKNVTKAAPRKGLRRQGKKCAEELSTSEDTLSSQPSPEKPLPNEVMLSSQPSPEKPLRKGSNKVITFEAPVTAAKGKSPHTPGAGTSDDSSPSVRTRVKNFEVMIERLTPSNQRSPKPATPKSLSELHTPDRKSKQDGQSKDAKEHTVINKLRPGSKIVEKESPKDSPVLRQTRTRLRLNKQPNEPSKETSTEVETEANKSKNKTDNTNNCTVNTHITSSDDDDGEIVDATIHDQRSSGQQCLSETEVETYEVYELCENGEKPKLQTYEMVKTKTTPVTRIPDASDDEQKVHHSPGFAVSGESSSDSDTPNRRVQNEKNKCIDTSIGMPTRTRTRAQQNKNIESEDLDKKVADNKDSGVGIRRSSEKANSTFTADSESGSDDGIGRSTRTRTRLQKEKVAADADVEEPVRNTRTRQRAQEAEAAAKASTADGTKQVSHKVQAATPKANKKGINNVAGFLASDSDEQITGSPSMDTRQHLGRGAKRLVEHGRGLSPAPKRARSNVGQELADAQPLSTSSPIKNKDESELRDKVLSGSKGPRPFTFTGAQRNISGFLNRTPGFSHNTSKQLSFLNTPNSAQRNNGVMRSFLKKTSPSPQQTTQSIMELRRQKLMEKQKRDAENVMRLKEIQKQERDEKFRAREAHREKVAATRQEQKEKQRQLEEQMMKKLGNTAALKAKILEEREREEAEKRKQRLKKQLEADLRRKQEEEERRRKRQEREEEDQLQKTLLLKKRKQEEFLRKQKMAEEKAKAEERLAEKEQKLMEERAKILQMQRERELMMEKARIDKENQLLQERIERERIEREKKAERERKLKEEMERLNAMEQERLQLREQELQKQRELKQLITDHNKSLLTQKSQPPAAKPLNPLKAAPSVLNTTQTLDTSKTVHNTVSNSNSYEITPAKTYANQTYDAHNYGLDDKESDDSTDDEEAPKKKIPEWAMGMNLSRALIKQCLNPPDLDQLFGLSAIKPPDLEKIFKGNCKRRYKERTSSAIWNTPPLKYC